MQAIKRAGISTPNLILSRNRRFLVVERFDIDPERGTGLGFEEVLGLMGKNREQKYAGSYEQVAKIFFQAATDKLFSMEQGRFASVSVRSLCIILNMLGYEIEISAKNSISLPVLKQDT